MPAAPGDVSGIFLTGDGDVEAVARPDWLSGESAPPLVGRARALRVAIDALAVARAGRGRVLALEGPPGIGKTRLLESIADLASGFEVWRARGSAPEREFGLGVARDLVEPLVAAGAAWPAGEPGVVIRALARWTLARAARAPLLLAVDDLHWADVQSLRYLAQVAVRLPGAPIVVAVAWHGAEPGAGEVEALLGATGERIVLEPLAEEAIAALLEPVGPGWDRLAGAIGAASAGRPRFAIELCRALAARRGRGPEELLGSVGSASPPALGRSVARTAGAFGPGAAALVQAVSVLGDDARLRTAAEVAGLDITEAAGLSDHLTGAGLFAPTTPLAFAAPVLRNVVYDMIPARRRALLHRAAARATAAGGAREEAIVEHVMRGEPAGDPHAVAVLCRAADDASAAGDGRRAARLLARALAEPPAEAQRTAILLALAEAESRVLSPDAERHLEQVRVGGGPRERARAALALADLRLLSGSGDEARALLEGELARLGRGPEPGAAGERLCAVAGLAACDLARAEPPADGWWRDAAVGLAGSTSGERARLIMAAAGAALDGEPQDVAVALARRGARPGSLLAGAALGTASSLLALLALEATVDPALIADPMDLDLAAMAASGSLGAEAAVLVLGARRALAGGALLQAEADARRALAIVCEHGLRLLEPLARASLVDALLDQGRLADARRALGGLDDEVAAGDLAGCLLGLARGRLQAVGGEAHRGLRIVLGAGARLLRAGCRTPGLEWRSRAGLIAHRLDRHPEAVRLIDDELALARRVGAPRALGVALRARALIASRPSQVELLEGSLAMLAGTPARLEWARTLYELGAARRRSGPRHDARRPLQEALQLAHECGAVALAERARHELVVLGARPRRYAVTGVAALTARERQTSELAAGGLTNRQIAAVMTVTANTVEYHLTNAYRKLGVGHRDELAAVLACPGNRREPSAVAGAGPSAGGLGVTPATDARVGAGWREG
jgi:DNA-binding CsgD family transcriptional regulator